MKHTRSWTLSNPLLCWTSAAALRVISSFPFPRKKRKLFGIMRRPARRSACKRRSKFLDGPGKKKTRAEKERTVHFSPWTLTFSLIICVEVISSQLFNSNQVHSYRNGGLFTCLLMCILICCGDFLISHGQCHHYILYKQWYASDTASFN